MLGCMQRLQDDPLQTTLETVMPLDQFSEDDKVLHVPSFVPATVERVCGIISRQPGIDALCMGRQVCAVPLLLSPALQGQDQGQDLESQILSKLRSGVGNPELHMMR